MLLLLQAFRVSVGKLGVIVAVKLHTVPEQPVQRELRRLSIAEYLNLTLTAQEQWNSNASLPDWMNETEFFWMTQHQEVSLCKLPSWQDCCLPQMSLLVPVQYNGKQSHISFLVLIVSSDSSVAQTIQYQSMYGILQGYHSHSVRLPAQIWMVSFTNPAASLPALKKYKPENTTVFTRKADSLLMIGDIPLPMDAVNLRNLAPQQLQPQPAADNSGLYVYSEQWLQAYNTSAINVAVPVARSPAVTATDGPGTDGAALNATATAVNATLGSRWTVPAAKPAASRSQALSCQSH